MTTHTPAEWAAAGFLGVDAIGVIAFALAFADADLAYFDPRPAWSRLVESGRLDPLLIAVGPALHDARQAAHRAAVALLALLHRFSAPEATR